MGLVKREGKVKSNNVASSGLLNAPDGKFLTKACLEAVLTGEGVVVMVDSLAAWMESHLVGTQLEVVVKAGLINYVLACRNVRLLIEVTSPDDKFVEEWTDRCDHLRGVLVDMQLVEDVEVIDYLFAAVVESDGGRAYDSIA